jgi:hypothetical protein
MQFNSNVVSNYNLDTRQNRNYEISIITPATKIVELPDPKEPWHNVLTKTTIESEVFTIKPPFTVSIDINRGVLASVNTTKITINNLSEETRNKLTKDQYTFSEYWQMKIKAGYGNYMNVIFQGNIQQAFSYKQGTEWITEIEGKDGLYAIQNSFTSMTAQKNTSMKDVMSNVINNMPGLLKGAIGQIGDQTTGDRGMVLMGKSNDILGNLSEGNNFIDNEKVYILDRNEYIGTEALIIDSNHLLATPKRRDTYLECEMMFLPEVKIGYLAELRSKWTVYNGQYIIKGIIHKFTWSGSSCDEAKTTISLDCGSKVFQKVAI